MLGELQPAATLLATAFCPAEKPEGQIPEEEEKPWTGAREARGSPPPDRARAQRARQESEARRGRRGQVRIAPFGWSAPSSAHSSGSTRRGGGANPTASPGAESYLSLHPGEGRLASPTRTPSPRLGSSGASSLLSIPSPPPPLPDPSPPGAPRLPSPTPAPRPGLSRTSLRSWRPHVFTGLSAPADVVSRSDFQARPQLRRQHQPGPTRAPKRCARRRRRARPPPLILPPRPAPAQPRPRARCAQPCHPPPKAAAAARTSASGGAESRRGSCRHPSPFSRRRRRRREPWPPPPARPRCPERPRDCELVPLTCWAGLCAPALGSDGCPGWDLGLLELMSNWGSAETGSEVSGGAGLGGGGGWRMSRRRAQRAAGRWRQRGRGRTPEQPVRLERAKTRGNRGAERTEERERS